MRAARAFLALSTIGALLSCSSAVAPDTEARAETLDLRYTGPGELVQTLRITNAEPAPGDTLWIVSTVTNAGRQPTAVTSRICGLDLRTEMRFESLVRCAGYSMQKQLAPGDSVKSSDGGVITSGPGTYSLRVRHLIEPERWVDLQVRVRGR